jgi:mannose-1-phosphate guanylyltransferase
LRKWGVMEHPKQKPYIAIMAGGGGTRLWPKSRQNVPKQFLSLFSHKTMLQETYSRIAPLTDNNHIYVIAPEKYKETILKQLPDLSEDNLVIEPTLRSTAPAIGLACTIIHKKDPDAVVHIITSDDYIVETDEFQRVLLSASIIAEKSEDIVVWGVQPTFPSTGYGYVHSGDEVDEVNNIPIFKVRGFKEKPNATTAQAYIATGKYFWNTCKFSQKASVMLKAITEAMPELGTALKQIGDAYGTPGYAEKCKEVYENVENIAVEYGIMERVKNLLMIPASYTWSDVGSWDALYDISPKNEGTNSILTEEGEFFSYDTHGCLVQTQGKSIAAIGLTDMVIVDTENVIMICPKNRCQDVKKLVEVLKERDKKEYL